jgi:hypothetical protein
MGPRRDDCCGARFRRAVPDTEPAHLSESEDLSLTNLGQAFIEALREDERFRDVIADPFGDQGPSAA